ncbi:hypothetical protein GJ496_011029 [Pomphorhynchus laevis]|nr:hypothetical protein GJ496_011029 [Pomphorhynchus laevis]
MINQDPSSSQQLPSQHVAFMNIGSLKRIFQETVSSNSVGSVDGDETISGQQLYAILSKYLNINFSMKTINLIMKIFARRINRPPLQREQSLQSHDESDNNQVIDHNDIPSYINSNLHLNFDGFIQLHQAISNWSMSFSVASGSNSATINFDEFLKILDLYGFKLSEEFLKFLFSLFDSSASGNMSFEDYLQLMLSLMMATKRFREFDHELHVSPSLLTENSNVK